MDVGLQGQLSIWTIRFSGTKDYRDYLVFKPIDFQGLRITATIDPDY